jgi:alpha-D-xyloside xylohydrolase
LSRAALNASISVQTFSFDLPDGILRLSFFADNGVRVTLSDDGQAPHTLTVPERPAWSGRVHRIETDRHTRLEAPAIAVEIAHGTGRLSFFDASGKRILAETAEAARQTWPESIAGHDLVPRRQRFEFSGPEDSLHGLGHQLGAGWDFRGRSLDLLQENTTIVVPFLYNSAGYGILWDNASHSALGNPIRPVPAACLLTPDGSEAGLQADYYRDAAMTDLKEARVDKELRHQWWAMVEGWHDHSDSPDEAFYVRWTGKLRPRHSGTHRIYLDLPVGGNLLIDGRSVIDSRGSHKRHPCDLELEAGREYAFHLESSQGTSWIGAYAYLQWQEPVSRETFSLWSQHAPALNYYVMAGSPDAILASYNALTGPAPLMPRYLFGYWQSREHYKNKDELVGVVEEHRQRDIPIDVVVQDWRYWNPRSWGEPWFDPERYPNHPEIFRDLHERLDCHLMLSNYAQFGKEAPLYEAFAEKGYLLPHSERANAFWIDAYNTEAVKLYWERTRAVFFDAGVDIFWLDTTEPKIVHPLTPESLLTGLSPNHTGDTASVLNAFSLYLCKGYYEAQREASEDRRVCLHSRSGFAGQQRYAGAVWTGDTEANWAALREQVQMALNMSFGGLPYWNTDIGGFFGKNPGDADYRELFIRWFQFGAFCPIMRNHGTNDPKEIWRFGPEAEAILREWIDLHYQLLPYFYSLAWDNHRNGKCFIRALLQAFPDDPKAIRTADAFMLGPNLLIHPVTEAGVSECDLYLPDGTDWYDFWTGTRHKGGQTLRTPAPLERIPVFVRAGSILPIEPNRLRHTGAYTGERLELRIYPGRDADFTLYEDRGDGYQYEKGEYLELPLHWNETGQALQIGPGRGGFPGAPEERRFLVRFPGEDKVSELHYPASTRLNHPFPAK